MLSEASCIIDLEVPRWRVVPPTLLYAFGSGGSGSSRCNLSGHGGDKDKDLPPPPIGIAPAWSQ